MNPGGGDVQWICKQEVGVVGLKGCTEEGDCEVKEIAQFGKISYSLIKWDPYTTHTAFQNTKLNWFISEGHIYIYVESLILIKYIGV